MNRRAIILLAAKLALSAGLLMLVLARVDVTSVLDILSRASLGLVIAWYMLVPLTMALAAWRWQILAPGLRFGTALKYTWIGVFFGHVLPGSIAGDIAKGVSLALKDAGARSGLAASIIADKVVGFAALILYFDAACAVVYALHGESSGPVRHLAAVALVLSLAGAAGAVLAAWVVFHSEIFSIRGRAGLTGRLIEGIGAAAAFYGNKPGALMRAFAISALIHLVNIFATYLSFRALHVEAGLLFAAIVYPVLSVMLLIPISISGIGVRDATLAVLFALFGLSAASGVALSWLALLAVIPNVVIGGSVQLFEMYRKHR